MENTFKRGLLYVALSVLFGAVSALAVWGFHQAMFALEWVLLNHQTGSLVKAATHLAPWRRVLTPMLGAFLAGGILWLFQRYFSHPSRQSADYTKAITHKEITLDSAATLVKCLVSLLLVVTGSALGREAAMVLLAVWLVWILAKCLLIPQEDRKLWMACGVAAGMAGAYHAPIAGVIFVTETFFAVLGWHVIGRALIAAFSAMLVTYILHGSFNALYRVPTLLLPSWKEGIGLVIFALLMGFVGSFFTRLLQVTQGLYRAIRLSLPIKFALGGLVVGLLSLNYPQVWGNGYSTVQWMLLNPPLLGMAAAILLYKWVAVLASLGSGAPGGAITPTLCIGVALGAVVGYWVQGIVPGMGLSPVLFSLAGMAFLLATTSRAPIMSAFMVCEMTHEVKLLIPFLLLCLVAERSARIWQPVVFYRARAASLH